MLRPGKIYPGTAVRVAINFTNDDDTDTDPTGVTFVLRNPSGTETTYVYGTDDEVVKESTGDYYVDVTPDRGGRWFYKWVSSGAGQVLAPEAWIDVQESAFNDYSNDTYPGYYRFYPWG